MKNSLNIKRIITWLILTLSVIMVVLASHVLFIKLLFGFPLKKVDIPYEKSRFFTDRVMNDSENLMQLAQSHALIQKTIINPIQKEITIKPTDLTLSVKEQHELLNSLLYLDYESLTVAELFPKEITQKINLSKEQLNSQKHEDDIRYLSNLLDMDIYNFYVDAHDQLIVETAFPTFSAHADVVEKIENYAGKHQLSHQQLIYWTILQVTQSDSLRQANEKLALFSNFMASQQRYVSNYEQQLYYELKMEKDTLSSNNSLQLFKDQPYLILTNHKNEIIVNSNISLSNNDINQLKKQFQQADLQQLLLKVNLNVPQEVRHQSLSYYDQPYYYEYMGYNYANQYSFLLNGFFGIIIILAGIYYLSLRAGQTNSQDKTVKLYAYDKWYTEIHILLLGTFVTILFMMYYTYFYLLYRLLYSENMIPIETVELNPSLFSLVDLSIPIIILMCFLFYIFMGLWLSFIRKIKAKRFTQDSIICRFFGFLKEIWQQFIHGVKRKSLIIIKAIALAVILFILAPNHPFIQVLIGIVLVIYLVSFNRQLDIIDQAVSDIREGNLTTQIDEAHFYQKNKQLAQGINNMADGLSKALEANIRSERIKTELITNVSHDLKTPLTSIMNYIDLIKRENIESDKLNEYLAILEEKAQLLFKITEDVLEASKLSSHNFTLELQQLNLKELMLQINSENSELFAQQNLELVSELSTEPIFIEADSHYLFRIFDNLYNNAFKYSLAHSRIYTSLMVNQGQAVFEIKNISAHPLNFNAQELMERFVRGDKSRSSSGSGLGLSITKDLVILQKGMMDISIDGDLFKVRITFPIIESSES